ncbi:MAG: tripartite tricarboxylate transporter substrate binding protein [Proteobacteria bacterium]|nr:tripartite tricarboxylate transporter substrate binding protein [Pseudomonadota bacterium]
MKSRFLAGLLALLLSGAGTAVFAQAYPNKPIRIIVPFTPGGGNDVYARTVGQKLSERLGQPVIVENKPGAGGNIGAELVARSAPDGYTLLLAQNGLTMAPFLSKSLPFDVMKDLAPIGIGVNLPMGLAVATSIPVKSVPELIAYAKANPGKLLYATPGIGTPHHLSTEMFLSMTGTTMVQVPYKGAAGMLPALMTGEVQVLFGALNSMLPHIQSGKIRGLALGDRQRNPILKDLPTVAETVPGYESVFWFGLMAPGGTPEAILNKLSEEQRVIVNLPDVRERLSKLGFEPNATTPNETRRIFTEELEKWGKVVRDAGIKAE